MDNNRIPPSTETYCHKGKDILENGTPVMVTLAYMGSGRHEPDDASGVRFVVGNDKINGVVQNYKVSKVNDPRKWEHWVSTCRVVELSKRDPLVPTKSQRPTVQEQCPKYRRDMIDAGRGHQLP